MEDILNIFTFGLHLRRLGMYESALDAFIRAENDAKAINAVHIVIDALMWQGECSKLLTRYIEAVSAFGRVLNLYILGEFSGEWALRRVYTVKFTLLEIGLAILPDSPSDRLLFLESLLTASEEALWWLRVTGKNHWRSAVLLQMANVLDELKRWEEAVSAAEEALSARLECEEAPSYTLSGHFITLASVLRHLGRTDEAIKVIDRTLMEHELPIADIIGAKLVQVRIFLDKSGFALTACDKAQEAVRLADTSESIVQRMRTRLTLAEALAMSNQWEKALERIDQAMMFQRGDPTYVGRVMRRYLRNALASLSQFPTANSQCINHIKQYLVELGPEEEPWGEKLSYNDALNDMVVWNENVLVTKMFVLDKFEPESAAETFLFWISFENTLLLRTLVSALLDTLGIPAHEQEILKSRIEDALSIRNMNDRKAYIVEVLRQITLKQSANK